MSTRGGIKAGRAFIMIEAIDATGNMLNKIGHNLFKWGAKLERMGASMMFKGLMSGLAATFALDLGRQFDAQMKKVEARTEGTAIQMSKLRAEARSVGAAMGYSAVETAKLMDVLGQLGFNRKQIDDVKQSILALARSAGPGTEVDTEHAAVLTGSILNAYQMDRSQENSTRIANLFAMAANRSNYSLEEFTETMKNAATVGAQMGIPLDELIALSAQLRDVSIQSESVGVAIRNLVLRMSNPSHVDKFNEKLEKLTNNTIEFKDKAGNLREIPTLMYEIGEAVKGLGTADKADILNELIGEKAVVAGMILSKIGNPFKNLMRDLQESDGYAQASAATMNSGVDGAYRKMYAAVESLSISLSQTLAPALIDISKHLMNGATSLSFWIEKNQSTVVAIAMLIPYTLALGAGMFVLGKALQVAGMGFMILGTSINFVTYLLRLLQVATITTALAYGMVRGVILTFNAALLLSSGIALTIRLAFLALFSTFQLGVMIAIGLTNAIAFLPTVLATLAYAINVSRVAITILTATIAFLSGSINLLQFSIALANGVLVSTFGAITLTISLSRTLSGVIATLTITYKGLSTIILLNKATLFAMYNALRLVSVGQMLTVLTTQFLVGSLIALTNTLYTLLTFVASGQLFTAMASGLASAITPLGILTVGLVALGAVLYVNRDTIFKFLGDSITWSRTNLASFTNEFVSDLAVIGSAAMKSGITLWSAFNGVNEALALGDTSLAWQIGLDGMSLAFFDFTDGLILYWDNLKLAIEETFTGAKAALNEIVSDEQIGMLFKLNDMVGGFSVIKKIADAVAGPGGLEAIEGNPAPDRGAVPHNPEREAQRKKFEEMLADLAIRKEAQAARMRAMDPSSALGMALSSGISGTQTALEIKLDPINMLNLEDVVNQILRGNGILTSPDGPNQSLKAIDGLRKNTVEAAKAAYENEQRVKNDANSIPKQQLNQLEKIKDNMQQLVEKLNIA